MRPKTLQGLYKALWPPEDDRKGERSDLKTNPFQEGNADFTMEALHQRCQLDSISNRLMKTTSKHSPKTINVFVFERGSSEYVARLNQSPVERVMTDLLKSRRRESESRENTRAGDFEWQNTIESRRESESRENTTGCLHAEHDRSSRRFTRPGEFTSRKHPTG